MIQGERKTEKRAEVGGGEEREEEEEEFIKPQHKTSL